MEKAGGAAVDATFLTSDVIERANALVVTHGRPFVSAAGAASEPELQSEKSAEADILRPIQTVAALARRSTE